METENILNIFDNYMYYIQSLVSGFYIKRIPNGENMVRLNNKNNFHSDGFISKILIQNKQNRIKNISFNELEEWSNDIYHGFFHGLITGFIYYFYKKLYLITDPKLIAKDDNEIHILMSCVLHDFCKKQENHDKVLRNIFPLLPEITYTHSNPDETYNTDPLIVSDRVELQRFPEHLDWIDFNKFKNLFNDDDWNMLLFFYKHVRPKLQLLWEHRQYPFIHHYIELFEEWDFNNITYYPQMSLMDKKNLTCVNMYSSNNITIKAFGGNIPIKLLKNDTVYLPREHPSISTKNKISIKDWIFTYEKNNIKNLMLYDLFKMSDIYALDVDIVNRYKKISLEFYNLILLHSFEKTI